MGRSESVMRTRFVYPLYFLLVGLMFVGCSKIGQVALLIDTSGSMKKGAAIDSVKTQTKSIVKKYANGKTNFFIANFDTDVRPFYSGRPQKKSLSNVFHKIDVLEANGQWTYMSKAVRYMLSKIDTTSSQKKLVYIFTDGMNEPPPKTIKGEVEPFETLLKRIVGEYQGTGTYIYFIDVSNGKKPVFTWLPDWIQVVKKNAPTIAVYSGTIILIIIFIVLIIGLIFLKNRRNSNSENIYTIVSLMEPSEDSAELERADGLNLNPPFFMKKRIDVGKKFPHLADFGPGAVMIEVDRFNQRQVYSKFSVIKVNGTEYENESWLLETDKVFTFENTNLMVLSNNSTF